MFEKLEKALLKKCPKIGVVVFLWMVLAAEHSLVRRLVYDELYGEGQLCSSSCAHALVLYLRELFHHFVRFRGQLLRLGQLRRQDFNTPDLRQMLSLRRNMPFRHKKTHATF